ncbi:MAG: hypothetical protein ACR2QK_18925, partial [Acidimicrobiales bacterium]
EDGVGAEAVAGLRRLRRRSPLARSAQSFADDIAKHLRVTSTDAPLGYLDQNRTNREDAVHPAATGHGEDAVHPADRGHGQDTASRTKLAERPEAPAR